MKILADQNIPGLADIFGELGSVDVVDGRQLTAEQLAGVDALLLRSVTRVDDSLLARHSPRFIGTATSGVDHIDREALARRKIAFAYAPGSNAESVVDYVLSAISHCGDKLEQLLAGAPCGIIGYGHIGSRLGRRLAALGIDFCAYDPWLDPAADPALVSLEQVLSCPVVSLHAELTREQPWPSFHMLAKELLASLPEEALLINAGRGELIAGEVLLGLMAVRPDICLVLDVWEGEPHPDPALLAVCRFGSAHIAGYSYDGKLRATAMLYRALCEELGMAVSDMSTGLSPIPVTLAESLQGAALIRFLLSRVYDIREDDSALREALHDNTQGGFDSLRKNYRQRRELGSLLIDNAGELSVAARSLCAGLGCRVD